VFIDSFKAVLFDLDGTLIDSMPTNYEAWQRALSNYQILLDKDWYYLNEGRNVRELIEELLVTNKLATNKFEELIKIKENFYKENYSFNLYPGIKKLLKLLQKKGIKIGMVTAGFRDRVITTIPIDVLRNFDVIVTGESTKKGKPYPDPYLYGINELNLRPNEVLAVENAPLGIESAKKAGIFCLAVSSTLPQKNLKEADIVFQDAKDLYCFIRGD
jgi:beta-phosphoglucomutase